MVTQHLHPGYTETYKICLKDAGLQGNVLDRFVVKCANKCKDRDCRQRCGCRKCVKNCNYPLAEELMDLSNKIDSFIVNKGKTYGQYLGFGYPEVCLKKTKELIVYKDILLKMHEGLLLEEKGLKVTHPICPNEYPKLKSEIISVIANQKIEFVNEVRDESNIDEWLLKNPKCISFDRWKRVFYNLCFSPEITVTPIIDKKCEFIYNVLSKEKDQCEIITKVVAQADKKCSVDYNVKVDQSKCKLEHEAIIKKGECKIEYQAFESAKKCGFTAKSIAILEKCGVSIKSDPSNKDCVILTTSTGEISCNKTNYKFIINNIAQCNNNIQ